MYIVCINMHCIHNYNGVSQRTVSECIIITFVNRESVMVEVLKMLDKKVEERRTYYLCTCMSILVYYTCIYNICM